MRIELTSTAPHVYPALGWQAENGSDELVMYRNPGHRVEGGLRTCVHGKRALSFSQDELWFVMHGRAQIRRDSGETLDLAPFTAVHFKESWQGEATIDETLRVSYMRCLGEASGVTPILRDALHAGPLQDLGPVTKRILGISQRAGIVLTRSQPPRRAESGIWTCSPGTWRCEVKSDEFCHFIAGSSLYTHDSGDQIEIKSDTLAFFPAGWNGICEVRDTVRKVYMIR